MELELHTFKQGQNQTKEPSWKRATKKLQFNGGNKFLNKAIDGAAIV